MARRESAARVHPKIFWIATEKSSSPDPLSRKEARATESDGALGYAARRSPRRDATCSPWWCVKPGSNPAQTPRNPTSPSSVVALPNERTKHLTPDPLSPAPTPRSPRERRTAWTRCSTPVNASRPTRRRCVARSSTVRSSPRVERRSVRCRGPRKTRSRGSRDRRRARGPRAAAFPRGSAGRDPGRRRPHDNIRPCVASPGRETTARGRGHREARGDARGGIRVAVRLRTLTVAADVAEAFARAEASIHEAEAALARGEYEIAAAALAATRDALRDASGAVTHRARR